VIITFGAALLGFLAGEMMLTDPAVATYLGAVSDQTVKIGGAVGALAVVAIGKWLSYSREKSNTVA
jgi:hypothetical protein